MPAIKFTDEEELYAVRSLTCGYFCSCLFSLGPTTLMINWIVNDPQRIGSTMHILVPNATWNATLNATTNFTMKIDDPNWNPSLPSPESASIYATIQYVSLRWWGVG